jgi:eukaryotic-like serine/threonine-protein kinase
MRTRAIRCSNRVLRAGVVIASTRLALPMARATTHQQFQESVDVGDGRRIELYEQLGKGQSSTVFRAVLESTTGIKRSIAFKLFAAVASDEADHVLTCVAQTAERAACVRHPNVVEVYDCGIWLGQPFLMSELVEGVTLHEFTERYTQKQRRLPLDLALFIISEVGEGLSGARIARDHEGMQLGMLHLGLSPREVLLSWRGEVKVTDFEVNRARAATSSVRSMRAVATRANMMAPEVAQGAPGDARSDVFSLGIMMRELLIGPRFPPGLTNAEAIRLAREGYVQPMCFQPHLPDALVQIMLRALDVEPEARFRNVSAMAFELRRLALALGVGDGRYFLRCALERLFGRGEEVTAERAYGAIPPADEQLADESDIEDA